MSTLPKPFVTPEQYLEIERRAEFKSEYYNGEMFAMSGVTRWHDWINTQLQYLIDHHLLGKTCELHSSDVRVLVRPSGLFTYPDLCVTCEEPEYLEIDLDTLTNPTLVFEVLSPSTEAYDRGKKARMCRDMASLRELVLISQEELSVDVYRKMPDGSWTVVTAVGIDGSIELISIGFILRLRDVYARALRHDQAGRFGQAG